MELPQRLCWCSSRFLLVPDRFKPLPWLHHRPSWVTASSACTPARCGSHVVPLVPATAPCDRGSPQRPGRDRIRESASRTRCSSKPPRRRRRRACRRRSCSSPLVAVAAAAPPRRRCYHRHLSEPVHPCFLFRFLCPTSLHP